tara:strand:- start:368 stop:895 length:528 start_codon:yes stop_codon:yes gene_type:complete
MEMNVDTNETDDEFESNWIMEIEEESKTLNDFFITENKSIKLYIYYINRKNELYNGIETTVNIENNTLKKSEIIELIRKYMYIGKKKFRLMSMLSYNFDLNNNEIKNYYKTSKNYDLLYIHKNIKSINYNESINYFKELNDLYLFFVQTKSNTNKQTKRIILRKKLKKTKRKRLK